MSRCINLGNQGESFLSGLFSFPLFFYSISSGWVRAFSLPTFTRLNFTPKFSRTRGNFQVSSPPLTPTTPYYYYLFTVFRFLSSKSIFLTCRLFSSSLVTSREVVYDKKKSNPLSNSTAEERAYIDPKSTTHLKTQKSFQSYHATTPTYTYYIIGSSTLYMHRLVFSMESVCCNLK